MLLRTRAARDRDARGPARRARFLAHPGRRCDRRDLLAGDSAALFEQHIVGSPRKLATVRRKHRRHHASRALAQDITAIRGIAAQRVLHFGCRASDGRRARAPVGAWTRARQLRLRGVKGTRVVCNPRGYAQYGVNENAHFDPRFRDRRRLAPPSRCPRQLRPFLHAVRHAADGRAGASRAPYVRDRFRVVEHNETPRAWLFVVHRTRHRLAGTRKYASAWRTASSRTRMLRAATSEAEAGVLKLPIMPIHLSAMPRPPGSGFFHHRARD